MITREKILEHMRSHHYQPVKARGLSRFFDITEEDYPRFHALVREMLREGQIIPGRRGRLRVPRRVEKRAKRPERKGRGEGRTLLGTLRLSPRGFGFVEPAEGEISSGGEDVFIPPGQTSDAITGDTVRVQVGRKARLGYRGRIAEIVERGQSQFVGTYIEEGGRAFIRPDGAILFGNLAVSDASSRGARHHDKVVFEVLRYPRGDQEPGEAVIVEVLGVRGDPGVDTLSVIRQFELPDEFSPASLDEARDIAKKYEDEEFRDRLDLTGTLTVTIDPAEARDFDDAISLSANPDGTVTLGVHIADVAHFVRPGSPLDVEAHKRGTSVYLPTLVIPMLPEILSNGLCSLQEGRPRLTKSVFITLDGEASVRKVRFHNSIIKTARRLTYGQVTAALEKGKTDGLSSEVVELLGVMEWLAKKILKRRQRAGYLELELPEVELDFDDDGRVVAAHPEDTSFSHKIIEMFMVEANEAVARHLDGLNLDFIRRIHPEPDAEAGDDLRHFAKSSGYRLPNPRDRAEIQALIANVRGKPEAYAMHLAILKSFQQAEYSPRPVGHFALASEDYCHFTSPIRRYPDLAVHRLLDEVIRTKSKRRKRSASAPPGDLVALAAHCTKMEQRAEDAERELTKIKVLELLEKKVGEVFDGVITGVQEFGLFVENPAYLIDGLVHMSGLTDDQYRLDKRRWALVGKNKGRVLRVGSPFKVRITEVNIPRRQLLLEPVDGGVKPERKKQRGKGTEAQRHKGKNT